MVAAPHPPIALSSRKRFLRRVRASIPHDVGARTWLLLTLVILVLLAAGVMRLHTYRERAALLRADIDTIAREPALRASAISRGRTVFAHHCAACHGLTAKGDIALGVPDLTDKPHLYGTGLASEIETIVLHGIRSGDSKGWNLASMPAYATPKPYPREPILPLSPGDLSDIVSFLRAMDGNAADPAATRRGAAIFDGRGGCWDCHGHDGGGDTAIGAPSLVDGVWLYGDGSAAAIRQSVAHGRHGVSPAFARRLDPGDARAVSVYVASLAPPPQSKDQGPK